MEGASSGQLVGRLHACRLSKDRHTHRRLQATAQHRHTTRHLTPRLLDSRIIDSASSACLHTQRARHATRDQLIPASSERGSLSRAHSTTSSPTSATRPTDPPPCLSQCRRLCPNPLPHLRNTSNNLLRRSSSHSNRHHSSSNTHRPTNIPRSSHRPQTHRHTPYHLQQRGSACRQTLDHRRHLTRTVATMRRRQIYQAPTVTATRTRLLPPLRSRHTRRTTS